ncbi:aminotransferase class I/II-fold pyridoxal phosphate-dependent enzyme [Petrocella sp. FN5]|uniref:aminotransferase class I/II-fold pyridoxal phosphate-dependent enzyme n=1 Tax=Petrocella sp. FN5 TaxID=3032002 RepID=UPI0023D9A635|nr:aminotransferase class I/II-fold pyridoxal phosphate-dependent enzyme [Petrocella sp. FN5]MDF1618158.1 aminotransferase class I/II-fold pyridoxal phosphate-dependent enzyme [Petrocella sp. FN5]
MENKLSQRASVIPPSGIRKFFDIVTEMKDAISLGVGEPDFDTPWRIREEGIYSLEKGKTFYTSNSGLLELREAICDYQRRRFNLDYDYKAECLVTVGGSEGIDLALRALINPGDDVLIAEPCFVSYQPCAYLAGANVISIPLKAENEFRITAEEIEAAITPKSKVLMISFPTNPTGAVMKEEHLKAISEVIIKHDLIVISDEIYAELSYGFEHVSIASLPGMRERTIIINGFSKAYAMTGWRMGYVLGPEEAVGLMTKIHQYAIMSAPTTSQYAALEAAKNCDDDVEMMRRAYNQRRRLMVEGFRKMGLDCFEPEGAFYVFPSIQKTGLTSEEFATQLLFDQKVAVVPGTAFGECGEGFIRCSYAYSVEELKIALERIGLFVEKMIKK